jgi:hypothetical protein
LFQPVVAGFFVDAEGYACAGTRRVAGGTIQERFFAPLRMTSGGGRSRNFGSAATVTYSLSFEGRTTGRGMVSRRRNG